MNRIRNSLVLSKPFINQSSKLIHKSFSTTRFVNQTTTQESLNTTQTTSSSSASNSKIITEEEASKSALLVSLHRRLNLPKEFKLSTLARCLTCRSSQGKLNNYGLNILGKNFLSYYVSENLLATYPRLPTIILNSAIDSYISNESLASIGEHSWGIEVDQTPILQKFLREEPIEYSYGKLRFLPVNPKTNEKGVTKITKNAGEIDPTVAYSLSVRSIIGALYASTKSETLTKKFIYDHILSRKLDISTMFEFEQPTRELSRLCKREGFEVPIARLLAENGRLTKKPVFVVGVFSGENKLGESYGSSLKEAKIRASVDALKKWYLYKPLNPKVPSDEDYQPGLIDHGIVIV
ncbi:54S ribosomal protein L3, mitochondrial [Wickerhamomyces ciferrii]|uniref:Large ribosomal subunit protein mL44 n=1 Tax=Wickerhamomyces ciferrii (strain ATCC 14091 / BCRC 22168 / CBS 111 / JCM 3599 / NBRC 0793 / NRRL Y-1031 F-60-10) TaxID=1206466 RepID=K0KY21_WICCF|nr:54S ribosomal protein L3, mitochondrial [Wickerhamomyces ciferrii]CCH46349.1 54S ribosomal protein L3, mitochondrial [Wickerhamomyces ciferrii]